MRTRISIFAAIAFAAIINAQTVIECPTVAVKDTMVVRTRVTRDFYFNSLNSPTLARLYYGLVDLDLKVSVATSTDTVTVVVYGIKRKTIAGSGTLETSVLDSTVVAAIPITATATWYSYPLDPLWTYFDLFDGIRVVYKAGGSDLDSFTSYANLRVQPVGSR